MANLLWKELYLAAVNRGTWNVLALMWLVLLILGFREQPAGIIAVANMVVAFLVTVTFASGAEGLEAARNQELLFCSLPLRRSQLVWASYALTAIVTAIGILYTMSAGMLLVLLLPDKYFAASQVMTAGEGVTVLLIMLFNAAFQNPFKFRFGSFGHRKLLYMGLIMTTVIVSFIILPLVMVVMIHGGLPAGTAAQGVQRVPLVLLAGLLNDPGTIIGSLAAFILLLLFSIALSIHYFNKRDL